MRDTMIGDPINYGYSELSPEAKVAELSSQLNSNLNRTKIFVDVHFNLDFVQV
jgi:hypothetical protein